MPSRTIAMLCPWVPPERSAITQYVLQAVAALSARARVHVVWVGDEGPAVPEAERTWNQPWTSPAAALGVGALLRQIQPDRVVLQYSPYLWSRSGFDLTGPAVTLALALAGAAPDIVWHELWVPVTARPVGLVRGLVQRSMAALMGRLARRSIVTSRERVDELAGVSRARERLAFVPMSSLVPVAAVLPGEREAVRARLGVRPGELVLALFGFDHDSRPTDGLARVHAALTGAGVASRLLVIGTARVPAADDAMRQWLLPAGFQPALEASRLLSASDLFLAPFVDGVSTRRSSIAAALAHRLPVITTSGHHTDPAVFHAGVTALAPVDDPAAFAREVVRLARDADARDALAAAGHALFERELSWPHHAENLWAVHAV